MGHKDQHSLNPPRLTKNCCEDGMWWRSMMYGDYEYELVYTRNLRDDP